MSDEEVSEGGGGGKGKLMIIIVAVLILLIAGGAAFYFLYWNKGEEADGPEMEEVGEIGAMSEPLADPFFQPLGTYIVNLRDGRRYLKATIQLMLSEAAAQEYLALRLAEVKDIVNTELASLAAEDIKQPESLEELRGKIISKINKLFPREPSWDDPEPIKKVLFEEIYLQ